MDEMLNHCLGNSYIDASKKNAGFCEVFNVVRNYKANQQKYVCNILNLLYKTKLMCCRSCYLIVHYFTHSLLEQPQLYESKRQHHE